MDSSTDAAILAALQQLSDRLGRIESRLDALEATARDGLGAVGVATDTFDRLAADVGEENVDARLRALAGALVPLTDPAVVNALVTLAGQAPALAALAKDGPGLVATVTDTVDGFAARAQAEGVDLDERGRVLLSAVDRLTRREALDTLDAVFGRIDTIAHLLRSRVLDETSVDVVSQAADALVETRSAHPEPAGMFALLGASSDPDVRRALGFALAFARNFGRRLPNPSLLGAR